MGNTWVLGALAWGRGYTLAGGVVVVQPASISAPAAPATARWAERHTACLAGVQGRIMGGKAGNSAWRQV
jgi:hypothetical protein